MRRFLISALALSMLAIPAANAAYRPASDGEYQVAAKVDKKHRDVHVTKKKKVVVKRHGDRVVVKKIDRHHDRIVIKKADRRHHWSHGKRVPDWKRRQEVRDYERRGLRRPGHNQRWIKVDNDYLLIGITSGVIASIIAAQ
jgi:Ni/Co efflux regulator RcnB